MTYAEATIQAFQRDSRVSSTTPFTLDLEIDEIAVTINERSNDYEVGGKHISTRVINPYAKTNICRLEAQGYASICTIGGRKSSRNDNYNKNLYIKRDDKPTRNTQMCKACLDIGHCINNPDTICYNVAKH